MNADGSGQTRLTSNAKSVDPAWLHIAVHPIIRRPNCTSGSTHLEADGQAEVSKDSPLPNRVRLGPSTGQPLIALLYPGLVIRLIEGPVCADDLVFWKVESELIPDGVGWTTEGDSTEYYLLPYEP